MAELVASLAQAMRIPFGNSRPTYGVESVIRIHRKMHDRIDAALIRQAFRVANQAHKGQMRKSGEPYIIHPIAVATILARLGMDSNTLAAALLHDTVEDARYALVRLRVDFGEEVARLVDGVTKLEKVQFGVAAEAESTRKLLVAASRDVRVLLIKLADRLHNMRTLGARSHASQVRVATATRDILVPLADRLGVQIIKRELEDLVLAALDPDAYAAIDVAIKTQRPQRDAYVHDVSVQLAAAFKRDKLTATVEDRPRHYSSVYERRVEDVSEWNDEPRVVVVVDGNNANCYEALGVIHALWRPIPGRFKDFIASPKFNLYKSLHTSVLGPGGRHLDVFIRTKAMHRIAEYGIAARHRLESHDSSQGCDRCWENESATLGWLQRLLKWQRDVESESFLESLRYDLADHGIVVFATNGRAVSLPANATPIDFAYSLGVATGDRCIGAWVNNRLTPLVSALSDGDVVDIVLSPSAERGPDPEWLNSVRSPLATFYIRRYLAEQAETSRDESFFKHGRQKIDAALAARERMLVYDPPLAAIARVMGFSTLESLYSHVADGVLSAEEVASRLVAFVDGK